MAILRYALFAVCGCIMAFGQTPATNAMSEKRLQLLDDGAMFRVRVEAFGEPLHMILDTGAAVSVLDAAFQPRLGSPEKNAVVDTPLASGSAAAIYRGPKLKIGGEEVPLGPVICSDLRMARFITGEHCDGILGTAFLTNFVITLNFSNRVVLLAPAGSARPSSVKSWIPITPADDGRFSVEARINGQTLRLVLDTGSTSSISLSDADWSKVFTDGGVGQASAVAGIGGRVAATETKRVALDIAGHRYEQLLASKLPNSRSAAKLGLDFFRRHTVTFDFPNGRLSLERFAASADAADMSGLHLLRVAGKTVVFSVDAGSPAGESGISEHDVLLSINSTNAASIKMRDIRTLLSSEENKQIDIAIERQGVQSTKSFRLKNLL
jgi:predicted aspartyl protease